MKKSRKERSSRRKEMTTAQKRGFALFLVLFRFDFLPFRLFAVATVATVAIVVIVMLCESFDVRLPRM